MFTALKLKKNDFEKLKKKTKNYMCHRLEEALILIM